MFLFTGKLMSNVYNRFEIIFKIINGEFFNYYMKKNELYKLRNEK